jgi:hypothetical protein
MGATEHRDVEERADPARRRFVTRRHVEDAAESGQPIRVQARDVVTDEAAQRAADLGVRIERPDRPRPPNAAAAPPAATGDPSPVKAGSGITVREPPSTWDDDLRRAVRGAVVAELGQVPAGLDAAIDRVLQRRLGEAVP